MFDLIIMCMKKLTSNLWRVVGKATLALALATPVLVSSCVKFDDSQLKQEISDINDELSKINEKITNLETRLNNEVAALTALINGKTTVASCTTDENTGVTTVVLSDGKTITVYPEAKMPDVSGITFLTTLEENNEYYWATCTVGGAPEFLLVDGEKVPVSVQPDLKIEDGKWFISVDGGKTWVETDIEEENEDEVVVFFTNVKEDDDYVYLTLASGTVVKVAKDKDVAFSVLCGKQYFSEGEIKAIPLQMKNVKAYTITEKPDGWKAAVKGNKLNITAPSTAENVDLKGTFKLLATFEDASPVIASVNVELGAAYVTIALDGTNVTFQMSPEAEEDYNYDGYIYGVVPAEGFTPEGLAEMRNNYPSYETGKYETINKTLDELVADFDENESYVIYVADYLPYYSGEYYTADMFQYVYYIPVLFNVEIVPALDNASLSVKFSGCDGFYGGCQQKDYFNAEDYVYDLGSMWGPQLCTSAYNGPAGTFGGGWLTTLKIATEYVVWICPQKVSGVYSVEDFLVYEFSTLSLSVGGNLQAPEVVLTQDPTFDQVAAQVTTVEGAYKTYAAILLEEDVPADELALVQMIINNNRSAESGNFNINRTSLNPGDKVVVCAVAVNEQGQAGQVTKFEAETKSIEFNDNLSLAVEPVSVDATSVTLKFTYSEGVASIKYCNVDVLYGEYGLESIESDIALGKRYDIESLSVVDLEDGIFVLSDLKLNHPYRFFAVAFDAEGAPSHLAETTFTPESGIMYVKKSSEDWAYGKPSFSNAVLGGPGWLWFTSRWSGESMWIPQSEDLTIDISIPAECKVAYVLNSEPSYYSTDSEISASDKMVFDYKTVKITESGNYLFESVNNESQIYVVWVDDQDRYHTYDYCTITWPEMPTEAPSESE